MSLTFSFLQEQVIEKSKAHDTLCTTIEHEREVIEVCTENAPAVIEAFKKKFAHYQKEKTNPSLWSKIQIIAARKSGSQTGTEKKYEEARENLRSLAKKRRTATRDLRSVMGGPGTILSRDALIKESRDPDFTNSQSQKKSDYGRLGTAQKEEEFTDFIETEGLTETVQRLRILDEYLTTNPTGEEMKTVMWKMTHRHARRVLRDHLIKIHEKEPKDILDLYADLEVWETERDKTGYWGAFDAEYKGHQGYKGEENRVTLCFEEILRHADEPKIYGHIIENYVPLRSSIEQASRIYLKLPVHIQAKLMGRINFSEMRWMPTGRRLSRCLFRDRYSAAYDRYEEYDELREERHGLPQIAQSFGQVIVQTMNPLEKAKFILQRDTSKGRYLNEAFSQDEIHAAAISYLENAEKYEHPHIRIAVEQLSEEEKTIYAKKMTQREDDVRFFNLFVSHVQSEDLDTTITLLKKTGHTGNLHALERGIIQDQIEFTECQKDWLRESVETIFREEKTCKYWITDMGEEISQDGEIKSLKGITESLKDHIFVTYFMDIQRHEAYGKNGHIREEIHKIQSKPFYHYVSGLIREKIQQRIHLLTTRAEITEKLTQ